MKTFGKLARLSLADALLLGTTLTLVIAVRLALCVLPFRLTRRLVAWMGDANAVPARPIPAARLAWAVGAAARRVPAASCLTQALALQVLCKRNGHPADVQIGVNRDENKRFRAHAWVESRGEILIGRLGNLSAFAPLPSVGL